MKKRVIDPWSSDLPEDYKNIAAHKMQDFLSVLKNSRPDLDSSYIINDYIDPNITGLIFEQIIDTSSIKNLKEIKDMGYGKLLEEIKKDPMLCSIPVVLLTVSEREEDVLEGALDKTEGQYFRNKVAQIIQISGRNDTAGLETKIMYQSSDALRKSTRAFQLHFQKQRSSSVRELIAKAVNKAMDKKAVFFIWDAPFAKMITAFGEDVQEANAISMSNPNAKRMIGLMQKYFNTKDKRKNYF